MSQAEMQVRKGENMIVHEDEIMSRPRRTWFESEKEKKLAKSSGRIELNGPDSVSGKKGKGGKLSGKDKKKLDDSRERKEGKVWKKGKAERTGGGALANVTKKRDRGEKTLTRRGTPTRRGAKSRGRGGRR